METRRENCALDTKPRSRHARRARSTNHWRSMPPCYDDSYPYARADNCRPANTDASRGQDAHGGPNSDSGSRQDADPSADTDDGTEQDADSSTDADRGAERDAIADQDAIARRSVTERRTARRRHRLSGHRKERSQVGAGQRSLSSTMCWSEYACPRSIVPSRSTALPAGAKDIRQKAYRRARAGQVSLSGVRVSVHGDRMAAWSCKPGIYCAGGTTRLQRRWSRT